MRFGHWRGVMSSVALFSSMAAGRPVFGDAWQVAGRQELVARDGGDRLTARDEVVPLVFGSQHRDDLDLVDRVVAGAGQRDEAGALPARRGLLARWP